MSMINKLKSLTIFLSNRFIMKIYEGTAPVNAGVNSLIFAELTVQVFFYQFTPPPLFFNSMDSQKIRHSEQGSEFRSV